MDLAPRLDELGWCPFARASGQPCPFCGGTRAILSIAGGNLGEAWNYNAMVVVSVILGSCSLVVAVITARCRGLSWQAVVTTARARVGQFTISGRPGLVAVLAFFWLWNLARW